MTLDRDVGRRQAIGDGIGEFRRRIGKDAFGQVPVADAVLALSMPRHDHVADARPLLEGPIPAELHHRRDTGRQPRVSEQCGHRSAERRRQANLHTSKPADIPRELRQLVDLVEVAAVAKKRLVHIEDSDEEKHIRQLLRAKAEHALMVAGMEFAIHGPSRYQEAIRDRP